MPRIALIQDGTEVGRQEHADVADFVRSCCWRLGDSQDAYRLETFVDEAAGHLLDGVTPSEFACLVFASNALVSGAVASAVEVSKLDLQKFTASGFRHMAILAYG